MSINLDAYLPYLPSDLQSLPWRAHPLDGALLLFERDSGLNVKLEGEETYHLAQLAPRTLLIAVTNHCNLTCHFCYRNLKSPSRWTYDSLLTFCQQADRWGVLEAAFGGGEPTIFPRWKDLICDLYETTQLAINFTTNGMLLTEDFLQTTAGKVGQIRLSLYEDNNWEDTIRLLTKTETRFGVNWLITPQELDSIQEQFKTLLDLGVRDFLLIAYKGPDASLHFRSTDYQKLEEFLIGAYEEMGTRISLKLDICWGHHLPNVPRLFQPQDCGAGDGFISITSDKRIKPCSFHHLDVPFETLADVRVWWEARRHNRHAAQIGGCARLPDRGLTQKGELKDAVIHLAAVEQ